MTHIFVAGGAGYIGAHVAKGLARAGHLPVTYDSLIRGHREFVKWGPVLAADIADGDAAAASSWTAMLYFRADVHGSRAVLIPGSGWRCCSLAKQSQAEAQSHEATMRGNKQL